MNDLLLRPMPTTDAEAEAMFEEMMAEIDRLNEITRQDQIEIDRLKAEIQLHQVEASEYKNKYLQETKKWEEESEVYHAEMRARLEWMEKMLMAMENS